MDITQLILDDHHEQRRLFAMIEQIDRSEVEALASIWRHLGKFLDTHAEAEERFFYPQLLLVGTGAGGRPNVGDETEDAIDDHNEIRDTGRAVDDHPVGSDAWFAAVDACNKANSKHMAEEEREGLTDFRRHADGDLRHQLAIKFAAFEADHADGVEIIDKDPKQYVAEHTHTA
ncbi:MAG: hemerythrin domain-containing protein [Caulobacteraceae bacterium]